MFVSVSYIIIVTYIAAMCVQCMYASYNSGRNTGMKYKILLQDYTGSFKVLKAKMVIG